MLRITTDELLANTVEKSTRRSSPGHHSGQIANSFAVEAPTLWWNRYHSKRNSVVPSVICWPADTALVTEALKLLGPSCVGAAGVSVHLTVEDRAKTAHRCVPTDLPLGERSRDSSDAIPVPTNRPSARCWHELKLCFDHCQIVRPTAGIGDFER